MDEFWIKTPSETLVSGSTIMALVRDIKVSDALKFPGIFTALICFKWNDFLCMTPWEPLVSGSKIMAQVRDHKNFWCTKVSRYIYPILMLQIEWYLIDITLRNDSVRFHDYGPDKEH